MSRAMQQRQARSGDLLTGLDFEAAIREVGTVLGGGPHYRLKVFGKRLPLNRQTEVGVVHREQPLFSPAR